MWRRDGLLPARQGGTPVPQPLDVRASGRVAVTLVPVDLPLEADEEDAERTALHVAALAGLLSSGVRLVAVAEASATDERGARQVSVDELRFSRVTALFADDPRNADRVATTLLDLSGSELPDAWDAPEHERLLAETDLLWHGPEEWSNLT